MLRAVDGRNFSLNEGEVLVLVGESGCGKSVMGSPCCASCRSRSEGSSAGTSITRCTKRHREQEARVAVMYLGRVVDVEECRQREPELRELRANSRHEVACHRAGELSLAGLHLSGT